MTESSDFFDEGASGASLSSMGETIRAQREQSQKFLSAQQQRLQGIEQKLVGELDRICGCLGDWETAFGEIEAWHKEVAERKSSADGALQEAQELQLKTQRQRRELAERFAGRRAAKQGKTAETIARLEARVEQLQRESDEADVASLETQLGTLHEQLAEEQARAKRLEADARSARDELLESRTESGTLRQQIARSRGLLDERTEQIKSLRTELEQLATNSGEEDQRIHEELERLRAEAQGLRAQLAEMETASRQESTSQDLEDLRCKYELAVENVRSLKHRNEELERELTETSAVELSGGFDWESQKEALLRTLDGVPVSAEDKTAKAKAESTIKITDRVIAQKDQELAELRARLEAHQAEKANALPPAPASEPVHATDEEIDRLKEEWREKLRAAEVDISVERAQNARVRRELEEKMRDLDAQLALAKKQTAMRTNDVPSKGWFRRS